MAYGIWGLWMLCGIGWSLIWASSWLPVDALRDRVESDQSDLDVIMVSPWISMDAVGSDGV